MLHNLQLILLLNYVIAAIAHNCCNTCECAKNCMAPNIQVDVKDIGVSMYCKNATCACVTDELDSCTYGSTWNENYIIPWNDGRWNHCLKISHNNPLIVEGLLRWWTPGCMGHVRVQIELEILPVFRDIYVDFNMVEYIEHTAIDNTFKICARTGSDDEKLIAGTSTLFFEVSMVSPIQGVHAEVTNCIVQVLNGPDKNDIVLSEHNIQGSKEFINNNGQRFTYVAFWDEEVNSPFQRLMCKYALFNGTVELNMYNATRSYMIANPDETGVYYS